MKKFFSVMLLAMALIFFSGHAEAREVYVGSYSDGTAVYLLTESISHGNRGFDCSVRAGYDYLQYRFGLRNGSWYYRNSEGYEGWVYDGSSPVAENICNYVRR